MADTSVFITTGEFVQLIFNEYDRKNACETGKTNSRNKGLSDAGHFMGKLQEAAFLDRKNAAWIVHDFLRTVSGEADEENLSPAKRLKDLYDCHTCVNHVAQVFVKGIMSDKQSSFGMKELLTAEEAKQIAIRMFRKEKRTPPKKDDFVVGGYKLSLPEAMSQKEKNPGTVIIDVRLSREYGETHLDGAISIPLSEILKNPYQVAENKFTPLLFYCENAYQSEMAANCVMEAGYWDVGYFALI